MLSHGGRSEVSDQDDALALVDKFEAKGFTSVDTARNCAVRAGVWAHISRAALIAGLRARIKDPNKINQVDTSLCGPADFVRDIAQDSPKVYAQAVMDLYETGTATIGTFTITSSNDLRGHALVKVASGMIDPSDWVILASIRNTANWYFDYATEDQDVSAITMPADKVKWFKDAGYTDVVDDTNLLLTNDLGSASRANSFFQRGYHVALFINSNMLEPGTMNDDSVTPDHWVAMTKPIEMRATVPHGIPDRETNVKLEVYSYGGRVSIPSAGRLTYYHFTANYYGFIACRR
jgi:hypothetical protein